jgi:chemotaxis protein methyltransferase CheR
VSASLEQLAELVRERSGIVLTGPRLDSLRAALAKIAPGLDGVRALGAARDPRGGEAFVVRLLEAVAVHETYFLRQRDDLDAIDWPALVAGAHARGAPALRAWVAGCSTGEEAYTLALLATEALGPRPPVTLLATDLSAAALTRAQAGRYGPRAVRNVSDAQRARHFAAPDDRRELAVGEDLRALVTFRRHNLVAEPPPDGSFDLILCRNVLIYFEPATVERVLATLEGALAPGGMLLLGAADRLCQPRAAGVSARSRRALRPVARRRRARPAESDRTRAGRGEPTATAPADAKAAPTAGDELAAAAPTGPTAATAGDELAAAAPTGATAPTGGDERVDVLRDALAAADAGRLDDAIAASARVLAADPLDADAHFITGVAQLGAGDAASAAEQLRRALYVDPAFALAAFQLARAHDALGDAPAAARAYRRTLRTLAPGHERQQRLAAELDLADVAAACGARLAALEVPAR